MKLTIKDIYKFEIIANALSNKTRLRIIDLLLKGNFNINEISKNLKMPVPTVTVNIQKLEESGLVECHTRSGKHGKQKICVLKYDQIQLLLKENLQDENIETITLVKETTPKYSDIINEVIDIPLGDYVECKVTNECGLASYQEPIGKINNPESFMLPERIKAQILWFNDGYVNYQLDIDCEDCVYESLSISFEACSEHMYFNRNWPSDITVWINDHELGTHTSEGNFTDGEHHNPDWWPADKSQRGEIITFEIDQKSTYINDNIIRPLKLKDVFDKNERMVSVKIGIKEDAKNCRGVVIFGKEFGTCSQNIQLCINYRKKIN